MPPTKRLRELTTSIPFLREAGSIVNIINTPDGWKNVSAAQCSRIATNLQKRLEPHRAVAYVGGMTRGIEEDPGLILTKMRRFRPHACKLAILLQAFSKARLSTPGGQVFDAYVACEG